MGVLTMMPEGLAVPSLLIERAYVAGEWISGGRRFDMTNPLDRRGRFVGPRCRKGYGGAGHRPRAPRVTGMDPTHRQGESWGPARPP